MQPLCHTVWNLDAELFLEGHDQLDDIEVAEPEVFLESRLARERFRIHVSLAGDDESGTYFDVGGHDSTLPIPALALRNRALPPLEFRDAPVAVLAHHLDV